MEQLITEIQKDFAASVTRKEINFYLLRSIGSDYPAWAVRFSNGEFGVAIPYDGPEVSEEFNEITFVTDEFLIGGKNQKVLMLLSDTEQSREQFAVFCYSLADPGENGKRREEIQKDPFRWWKEWKELVGNSAVNKKPYAVIGELLVVKQLLDAGKTPSWGGPDASTKDIETENTDYEVKSTLSRYGKSITISSQFQLTDTGKRAVLVFNRFEPKAEDGMSINSLVSEITSEYSGWSDRLESNLRKLGYQKGRSSRDESYILLEQQLYEIDKDFPRIDKNSFVGGEIPKGITRIEYTVDLDACNPASVTELAGF